MKLIKYITGGFLLLLTAGCATTGYVNKANTAKSMKLMVQIKAENKIDEPLWLNLTLTNLRTNAATWNERNKFIECHVKVFDSNGKLCDYTKQGYQLLGGDEEENGGWNIYPQLAPGASHVWKYDLMELFVLKQGAYTVAAKHDPLSIEDPTHVHLSINGVKFKIAR